MSEKKFPKSNRKGGGCERNTDREVCAPGRSGFCVSVWEYCRDRFTVVRVGRLSSRTFILGRFVSVSMQGGHKLN